MQTRKISIANGAVMKLLQDMAALSLISFCDEADASPPAVADTEIFSAANNDPPAAHKEADSYTKGLPYFGKYDLGPTDLSTTYKQRLPDMIRSRKLAGHFD
jgi:hypothetical protein